MATNLYIIWQDSFVQDEGIIDEQHHALVATINSLHYFLLQGQGLEVLMPTVKILVNYLIFHSKTEEGILRAAEYPDLSNYIQQYQAAINDFKEVRREAISSQDPQLVLHFLMKWWKSHLAMHDDITPYLNSSSNGYCRVD